MPPKESKIPSRETTGNDYEGRWTPSKKNPPPTVKQTLTHFASEKGSELVGWDTPSNSNLLSITKTTTNNEHLQQQQNANGEKRNKLYTTLVGSHFNETVKASSASLAQQSYTISSNRNMLDTQAIKIEHSPQFKKIYTNTM